MLSLPSLLIISLSEGGNTLVAVRVKTHPQKQINTDKQTNLSFPPQKLSLHFVQD